jgi:hypothetical protein
MSSYNQENIAHPREFMDAYIIEPSLDMDIQMDRIGQIRHYQPLHFVIIKNKMVGIMRGIEIMSLGTFCIKTVTLLS